MKVTLRDVVILVSTVALIVAVGELLKMREERSAHIKLVRELTVVIQQSQQQSQQQLQTPVPPPVPKTPKEP